MKGGLPTPAHWLVMVLFLIAAAATVYWIRLYVRDGMIGEELPEGALSMFARPRSYVVARRSRPYNASSVII